MLQRQQAQGAVAGAAVLLHLLVEALLQPGLGGVGPHQGQAGDGLGQQARQLAHLALAALGRCHHPGAETAHQQGDHGGQQQGGQGQGPVEPEHRGQHRQQLQGAGQGVVDRLVDHLAHPVGVLGEAVGEVAGGELVEGAEAQLLQPGEQLLAQTLAHPQGRIRQQAVLAELGQFLHQEHQQGQQHRAGAAGQVAGAERGDQAAGQQGQ